LDFPEAILDLRVVTRKVEQFQAAFSSTSKIWTSRSFPMPKIIIEYNGKIRNFHVV
jgi:hypothetical protein